MRFLLEILELGLRRTVTRGLSASPELVAEAAIRTLALARTSSMVEPSTTRPRLRAQTDQAPTLAVNVDFKRIA